jgi:hypothetical protein
MQERMAKSTRAGILHRANFSQLVINGNHLRRPNLTAGRRSSKLITYLFYLGIPILSNIWVEVNRDKSFRIRGGAGFVTSMIYCAGCLRESRAVTSNHVGDYIAMRFREDNRRGSVEALKLVSGNTSLSIH